MPVADNSLHRTTSDRYGHLYQAARDRLGDHLDETYAEGAIDADSRSA